MYPDLFRGPIMPAKIEFLMKQNQSSIGVDIQQYIKWCCNERCFATDGGGVCPCDSELIKFFRNRY